MKKIAAIALAAVLSFGCAAPAFAAGPHHGTGRCLNYSEFCQSVAQTVLAPGLQSLNDRLSSALAQVNGNGYGARSAAAGVDTYATSPSLCANGACGRFLDADGDGVCDYHGQNCTNMGGGNYVDADGDGVCDNYGTNRQGTGNGINGGAGTGYGSHHGAGHHGGYHR